MPHYPVQPGLDLTSKMIIFSLNQEIFDQGGDQNVIDFQFLLNPVLQLQNMTITGTKYQTQTTNLSCFSQFTENLKQHK